MSLKTIFFNNNINETIYMVKYGRFVSKDSKDLVN